MRKININTSYNVPIEYQLALVGDRLIANIFDLLIKAGYGLVVVLVIGNLNFFPSAAVISILMLPVFFYNLVCELVMQGQTIGMRIRNIKVVRLDGGPVAIGDYFLRWIFRSVDVALAFGSVAIVSIAVSNNGQRLGDMAAGTTVVKLSDESELAETIFQEADQDHEVMYEQVRVLNDKEIADLKEALVHYKKYKKLPLLFYITDKLKPKLGIEGDIDPELLLSTLIKDYYHIYSGTSRV